MARRHPPRWCGCRRFPRPRGDGPASLTPPTSIRQFSPPTRGWPVLLGGMHEKGAVFPAHAGMARGSADSGSLHSGFPRPRGDGPPDSSHASCAAWFSPPTRGWPVTGTIRNPGLSVFPAHAGMARTHHHTMKTIIRFPRPRGDGPPIGTDEMARIAFSPPTRGWPGLRTFASGVRQVFPAHAGMARGRRV